MFIKKYLFILFIGILFFSQPALAESYDFYVDKDCEDTQDGSEDKPYCKISDALEKASSSKNKIYIKSGTYKEKIVLEEDIEIYGKDADDVIIENTTTDGSTILGEGYNTIKNVTVKGGHNGIALKKEGAIKNCIIKNVSKNAIDLEPNDGKVEIANNKIFDNAKGIYVESGRTISIYGNEITENSEEGVDLRENISGSIKNNDIYKNGEGGIEFIVGKANLIISNNTISKNKASGVAAQFYSFVNKIGEVKINNNKISENKEYGLTCKNTLGGSFSKDYWGKSIELSDNTIKENKIKAIDPNCAIIKAVDEEEEKKNLIEDSSANEEDELKLESEKDKETEEERRKREEQERQAKQEIVTLRKVNEIEFSLENYITESKRISQEIENRNKVKVLLFGFEKEKISELINLNSQQENNKKRLEELSNLTQKDSLKDKISSINRNLENILSENQKITSDKLAKKGVLGWLINIFN